MFIELAEYLRCPQDPKESHCVVAPYQMVGRRVIRGIIGCPATKQQYRIADGVADFTTTGAQPPLAGAGELSVTARTVQSLLGLTTPGGYIVLLGSAAKLALALSELVGGIHFVGLNVSDGIEPTPSLSVLLGPYPLPLRTSMARGVVIGAEYASEPWLAEGGRLLLRGLRVVVLKDDSAVPGTDRLASGQGLWVGQKN